MTAAIAQKSRIVDAQGDPFVRAAGPDGGPRYETLPNWMANRHWEAAETSRLNEAHWTYDSEAPINDWLVDHLWKIRARAIYESRQNGFLAGIANTLADDVVGPDGPQLEVQSGNKAYNEAKESVWREWFKSPTTRANVSGAATLRLWVRNFARCGEFLSRIITDPAASGPVKMRLWLTPARDLATPAGHVAGGKTVLGVELDRYDRPVRYWIAETAADGISTTYAPWPPDLVIHEFVLEEEQQARGYPWLTTALQPSADLRDYDDQVQDAARQMADQASLLYCENPDEPWLSPESTTIERRTIKTAPPGWKPFQLQASQPPVQYPQYKQERQAEIARAINMPLMIARLDSARHNYSSARFDGQGYARFVAFIQLFLSGSPKSVGTLDRLVDEVEREARFSVPALRDPPPDARNHWTWPARPHVDPGKEATASKIRLETGQSTLSDELAERGRTVDVHLATLKRDREAFEAAGQPMPAWMRGETDDTEVDLDEDDDAENAKAASNHE